MLKEYPGEIVQTAERCAGCGQTIEKGTPTLLIHSTDTGMDYLLCGRCEIDREEHPEHFPII